MSELSIGYDKKFLGGNKIRPNIERRIMRVGGLQRRTQAKPWT